MINPNRTLINNSHTGPGEGSDDDAATIDALQKKIEFYEAIINNLPNDLVVFDTSHTYLLINKSAIRDPELRKFMIGRTDFDYCEYKKLPKSIAEKRHEKFSHVMNQKTSLNWEETKKVGEKTEVVSRTMRPVLSDDGDVRFMLGYALDISDLRATEALLQDLNRHLQEQVDERTRELTESNRSLENFAYSVSHDLRGPLRHISAYSSLLKKSLAGNEDKTEEKDFLNYIITAVQKIEQQIEGLLKLSRISSNKLDMVPVPMQEIFTEALNIYENYYELSSLDSLIKAEIEIMADRNLMSTVIENIISNAIKYSLPTGHVYLEIGHSVSDGEVIFSVRDKGIGFDMQYYDKLFGVFQRLHTRSEIDGQGIGLSHVKQIIDKHGGRIWAESALNEGTVFYFALPHNG
jgi:signal transduction histidine kinase